MCFSPSLVHTEAGYVRRVSLMQNIGLSNAPEPLWAIVLHPCPSEGTCSEWEGDTQIFERANVFLDIFLVQIQVPFLPSMALAAPSLLPLPRVRRHGKEQLGSVFGKQSVA